MKLTNIKLTGALVVVLAASLLVGCAGSMRARARLAGFADADPVATSTAILPVPVDPDKDIVNVAAQRELTLGMAVEIHVMPQQLALTHVGMMLVRRQPRGQDVKVIAPRVNERPTERSDGNWIIVEAMGQGQLVSRTAISDTGVDASEAAGVVAIPDRLFMAALPTPRRIDTLVITSTATGESVRTDVTRVMDEYCAATPAAAPCRSR